jgi:hypothetical protein
MSGRLIPWVAGKQSVLVIGRAQVACVAPYADCRKDLFRRTRCGSSLTHMRDPPKVQRRRRDLKTDELAIDLGDEVFRDRLFPGRGDRDWLVSNPAVPVDQVLERGGGPMSPGLGSRRRRPGRFPAVAKIVVFDIAGPLALYLWLRSAGWSTVTSLVVSGVLPAAGVILGIARKRRIDVVGAVVLLGIAVGTTLGLATGSARLVLLEGSVPTAIFGAVCLGSIWTSRPLMYRFAVEFMGEDTPRGQDFAANWRYPGFRHAFKVTTVVWGVA